MSHRSLRRAAVSGSLVALVAGCLVGLTPPQAGAAPPYDADGPASGTGWLGSQLDDGLLAASFGDGADVGLTIDAALAFDDLGRRSSAVERIADAVEPLAEDYVSIPDPAAPYYFAGETAKTLVLTQSAGRDPRAYGGVDLVERLESLTGVNGRIADVYEGVTEPDSANTISQSFAVQGLRTAGSDVAAAATDHLLRQQCEAGYFSLALSTGDATCDSTDASPQVDATALALLALRDQAADPDVATAITAARRWLRSVQLDDGAFGSDDFIPGANANSTGLAAWALGASGARAAAQDAAIWLREHQLVNTASCTPYAAADEGAIGYDDSGLDAAASGSIPDGLADQFRRASAQALPGLGYAPDGAVSEVTGRSGFVRAGSRQLVTLAASPGDLVCLASAGSGDVARSKRVARDGQSSYAITMPNRTVVQRFLVEDGDERLGTAVFRVLAPGRLDVSAPVRAGRGQRVVVAVSGLQPGERATVRVRGVQRGTDVAGSRGIARVAFTAGGRSGTVPIRAFGRFQDIRSGATSFRLTR